MRSFSCVLLLLGFAAPASAQESWTYRVRFQGESSSTRSNRESPIRQAQRWDDAQLFVLAGDATWTPHERFRFSGSAASLVDGSGEVDGRLREGYVRAGATSWLDFEAGKRIVRWGVGYGFAPAGVLDPPRRAVDPTDRLQLNEGRTLVKADVYFGGSAASIAATEDLVAARLGTVLRGGIELGIIAAAGSDGRPRYAATVTHVVGQQLEVHGEMLWHDEVEDRTVSASVGLQYTFSAGLNVVVEYHRNGRGLTDAQWNAVRRGEARGAAVARRNALFVRAARAGHDLALAPELIVIVNTDDGSWTVVPSIAWTPQRHVQVYARATRLLGNRHSLAGSAPTDMALTIGGLLRF